MKKLSGDAEPTTSEPAAAAHPLPAAERAAMIAAAEAMNNMGTVQHA